MTAGRDAAEGLGLDLTGLDLAGTDLSRVPGRTSGLGSGTQQTAGQAKDPAVAGQAAPRQQDRGPADRGGRTADGTAGGAQPASADPPETLTAELRPVALTVRQAALRRALFRRRGPLILKQGQQQAAVRVSALPLDAGSPDPDDTPWLALTVDGAPAALALPWSMARRVLGQPVEAAPPEDAALLIEEALADWLDAAEMATGLSLRLDRLAEAAPPMDHPVGARLTIDLALPRPVRQAVSLRLSDGAAEALSRAMERQMRPRADLPNLMLRVAVELSVTRLALAELRSLAPGDALLLSDEAAADAVAVVEDRFAAPARSDAQGRWTLAARLAPRPLPTARNILAKRNHSMTHPDQGGGHPSSSERRPDGPQGTAAQSDSFSVGSLPRGPMALDDLELRLSIRVGEALMALSELREAGPGTVITLDRPDGALVDVVVNGQVIGTGQIITVAGQKACEIRTLFGDG